MHVCKMEKFDVFFPTVELDQHQIVKSLPLWTRKDFPSEPVVLDFPARLDIHSGSLTFQALDDANQVIYQEVFSTSNQQTLLRPNVKHLVVDISEDLVCQLSFYN